MAVRVPQRFQKILGYTLAVFAAVGWATGGLISKWLFTPVSEATATWPYSPLGLNVAPTALSASRAASATIILGMILLIFRRSTFKLPNGIRDIWFLSVFGAVAMAGMHYTYFKTVSLTNVATAILLEYLAPIITLAVGVLFYRHKLRWQMPAGVALALIGCAIVVGAFRPSGLLISPESLTVGLISALFFALYTLMGSHGSNTFDPFTLLWYGLFFAGVMWLVVLGPTSALAPLLNVQLRWWVVLIACISTIIPFGAFLVSLRYISPTHATVTAMLEPVVAGVGAWLLFKEPITLSLVIGGIIVLGAITLIQLSDSGVNQEFPPQD